MTSKQNVTYIIYSLVFPTWQIVQHLRF